MARFRATLVRAWREERLGVTALAVLVLLALAAVLAPLYAQPPDALNPLNQLAAPSWSHLFGTDDFGRDVFSRVAYAGRVSLGLGLAVTASSSLLGTLLGMLAGFISRLDGPVMRLMDGMMAFPPLILAIALVAALGAGLEGEFIALSVVFTPRIARVMRGSTLQLRHREFVDAARLSGVRTTKILVAHILPNAMAPLVVQASFNYAEAILADAALSFLGLGVPPPTPTWGNMIASARTYLSVDPWFALFPGLAIVLAVMSLNLAGDSLRSLLGVSRQRSAAAARLGRFRPRGPKLASLPGEVGGDLMAPAGTGSGAGLQAGEGSHLTSDWS